MLLNCPLTGYLGNLCVLTPPVAKPDVATVPFNDGMAGLNMEFQSTKAAVVYVQMCSAGFDIDRCLIGIHWHRLE